MDGADAVWLVSPHLLLAQTTAVALASAGTAAEARPWRSTVLERRLVGGGEGDPPIPSGLVVVLDGFDDLDRVAELVRLVQTTGVRILLVASLEVGTWWGELLQDERVDLAADVTSITRLAEVVHDFVVGIPLVRPEGRDALRREWLGDLERRHHVRMLVATLSPQQALVLELLASGRRVAEVGAVLGVTSGTVRSHVKALRAKLGARSQLEAVAMLRLAHDTVGPSGSASTPGPARRAGELVPRPRRVRDGSGAGQRR